MVDAAVDWHFSSLRPGCSALVWALALAKTVPPGGTARRLEAESPAAALAALASLELALDALEGGGGGGSWLLSAEGGFLAGRRRLSIADLLVATELDQLRLLEVSKDDDQLESSKLAAVSFASLLAPRPRVRAYLYRTKEACGPHWDEVSSVLDRVAANLKKKKEGGRGWSAGQRARL